MKVLVIGRNGLGLMPTSPRKARILLQSGKAVVVRKTPFTIRLLYKTGCAVQKTDCGIDTGSQHIGVAVVSENKVLSKEDYELRSTMEKRALIEQRREYRRGRRYRKTRYRKVKFRSSVKRVYTEKPVKRNGHLTHWEKVPTGVASNRPKGWLPPSVQSKVDHHVRIISRYREALPPGTRFHIEEARFDIARMKDPTVHGELYQRGRLYDWENIKAYVFARDNYKCKACGRKAGSLRKDGTTVKLIAHHIDFKSLGATDNPDRIATVCDACHNAVNHAPGGILYEWMKDEKAFARGYRDATFMNILRKRLHKEFPDAFFTYGNITEADRKALGMEKSHANDAVAIACGDRPTKIKDIPETVFHRQVRSRKRSLHEANARKGRKEPNRTAKRNRKNTKSVVLSNGKKLFLFDKVSVHGRIGWISGFTGQAAYVLDEEKKYISYITKNGTEQIRIPLPILQLASHHHSWITYAKEESNSAPTFAKKRKA